MTQNNSDLAHARKQLRWSQAQLARILGVHVNSVSAWERGRQPIPRSAWLILGLASASPLSKQWIEDGLTFQAILNKDLS